MSELDRNQSISLRVLGNMPASEAAIRLAAVGDKALAEGIRQAVNSTADIRFAAFTWPWAEPLPVYRYTDHAFGYIPMAGAKDAGAVDIIHAGHVNPDNALAGESIKITLDRLRVWQYPGGGAHTILFDFYAQHVAADHGEAQDLHFTQKYRVQEGSGAGISGYPVFVGLRVGSEGVSFKCSTVNVSNADDERLLRFMDGDVFRKGLHLISSINPALAVVTGFATGIVEAFAHRTDNVGVQDFYLGLDFSRVSTRAQLREGSYIAVQVEDAATWDWNSWVFQLNNGQIVDRATRTQSIPLNYIVFSISKMAASHQSG